MSILNVKYWMPDWDFWLRLLDFWPWLAHVKSQLEINKHPILLETNYTVLSLCICYSKTIKLSTIVPRSWYAHATIMPRSCHDQIIKQFPGSLINRDHVTIGFKHILSRSCLDHVTTLARSCHAHTTIMSRLNHHTISWQSHWLRSCDYRFQTYFITIIHDRAIIISRSCDEISYLYRYFPILIHNK